MTVKGNIYLGGNVKIAAPDLRRAGRAKVGTKARTTKKPRVLPCLLAIDYARVCVAIKQVLMAFNEAETAFVPISLLPQV